jgi:hypothetical protein
MRRTALAAACLAVLTGGAAAPAAGAAPPPLAATLTSCVRSADAAQRAASFTARMPALRRTERMLVRFDLFQRTSQGEGFTRVRVPRWGVWHRSKRGVAGFVFTKHVNGLQAPGDYRAVVRFRWLDAAGRTQRTARRVTHACKQPDLRPDLRAARLAAVPGPTPGTATYSAVVVNSGRGPAGPFAVALAVGDAVLAPQMLEPLGPRSRRALSLQGPRCAPGTVLRLTVDSAAEVAEASETDNVLEAPCPLGAAGGAATLEGR